jgi:hypothetical protein
MVVFDTRDEENEKDSLEDIADAYQQILTEQVVEDVKLKVILILLNKGEVWGNDIPTQNFKKRRYEDEVLADTIT